MSAVPIDCKAHGSLLAARDSYEDFAQDVRAALPAIRQCGVADVSMKALWLEENMAQIEKCLRTLIEQTTEAHANKFPGSAR